MTDVSSVAQVHDWLEKGGVGWDGGIADACATFVLRLEADTEHSCIALLTIMAIASQINRLFDI